MTLFRAPSLAAVVVDVFSLVFIVSVYWGLGEILVLTTAQATRQGDVTLCNCSGCMPTKGSQKFNCAVAISHRNVSTHNVWGLMMGSNELCVLVRWCALILMAT